MVSQKIRKPNFFIIGAPRTGTTSLSKYLRTHPDVFFSTPKEPNYFCVDFSDKIRKIKNKEDYLNLFKRADKYQAVGEGSVWYLYSQEAVSRIKDFNPRAKFIVMVRNPIEMAYSGYYMSRFCLYENVKSFNKSWHLQEQREKGKHVPFYCPEPKFLQRGKIAKTGEQLERLFKIIPKEKIKVIVFDDFVSNTQKVYQEVLSFLGLKDDQRKDFPVFNKARIPRLPIISWLGSYFFSLPKGFFKWNIKKSLSREISSEFKKELQEYFKQDVNKLSRLLNRDLSYWLK